MASAIEMEMKRKIQGKCNAPSIYTSVLVRHVNIYSSSQTETKVLNKTIRLQNITLKLGAFQRFLLFFEVKICLKCTTRKT